MSASNHYFYTISGPSEAEFREKGSRFIAMAQPVDDPAQCKAFLAASKKAYPGATHYCFAWRIGTGGESYRVSDDGEPSGTAGRPILGQIDKRELTDVMVIVVRYFGGTLLGTAGLMAAYRHAAALSLQTAPNIRKPVRQTLILQFDYARLHPVLQAARMANATVQEKELQLFCRLKVLVPKDAEELFRHRLAGIGVTDIQPGDKSS